MSPLSNSPALIELRKILSDVEEGTIVLPDANEKLTDDEISFLVNNKDCPQWRIFEH